MNRGFLRASPMGRPPSPQRIVPHSPIQNIDQHPPAPNPRDAPPVRKHLIGWPGGKIHIDTENGVLKGLNVSRRVYGRYDVRVNLIGIREDLPVL